MATISRPSGAEPGGEGAAFQIGAAFYGRPLMLAANYAAWLRDQLAGGGFEGPINLKSDDDRPTTVAGVELTKDGVARLPIHGALTDRAAWWSRYLSASSYEGIIERAEKLAKDDRVKAVVLDINSPGGMVAGVWEAAAALSALAKAKPVYALAHNAAHSAAYLLACSARRIWATEGASLGSIGVIVMHASYARAMASQGVDVTIITAGDRKAMGSPYRELADIDATEISEQIDAVYEKFCAHVAARRAKMDVDAVRDTAARVFEGPQAVEAGLADSVGSLADLMKAVRREIGSADDGEKPKPRGGATEQKGKPKMTTEVEFEEIGDAKPAQPAAKAAASAPSAADERARIRAVMAASDGFSRLAECLAFDLGLSADAAARIFAAAAADRAALSTDRKPAAKAAAPAAQASAAADDGDDDIGSALAREMAKPGRAAAIKPDASAGSRAGSLATTGDKFMQRRGIAAKKR